MKRERKINFSGKTVWITGSSSGIGAGLARRLARDGAALILSGRNRDALAAVEADCRRAGAADVCRLAFDVTDFESLPGLVEQAEVWRGGIDVLICNAGISQRSLVRDTSMAVYHTIMAVDFFAPVALTRLVLPGMIKRGGGLICVTTSVAGKIGSKFRSGYCAAKHALHGFFDCLRAECHEQGIRVALIVPAYVQSDVAVNAVTGDGGQYGKRETGHDEGMSADAAADLIVGKLKKGREEILVGSGPGIMAVYLKRFFPALYSAAVRRQPI